MAALIKGDVQTPRHADPCPCPLNPRPARSPRVWFTSAPRADRCRPLAAGSGHAAACCRHPLRVAGAVVMDKLTTQRTRPATTTSTSSAPTRPAGARYAHARPAPGAWPRGRVRQAWPLRPGDLCSSCARGRAHLPAALRGGLEHGDPVGRLRLAELLKESRAQQGRSSVHDPGRPQPDAGPALRRVGLALCGGPAHRRGHVPARLLALACTASCCPSQTARPLHLALPWKYGKSIKSIVKIRFVEEAASLQLGAGRACHAVRFLFQRQPTVDPPAAGARPPGAALAEKAAAASSPALLASAARH